MTPELGYLGDTFEEAQKLQISHNDVLLQMESKQSPVEEMLRQADELIIHQNPKGVIHKPRGQLRGPGEGDWPNDHFITSLIY